MIACCVSHHSKKSFCVATWDIFHLGKVAPSSVMFTSDTAWLNARLQPLLPAVHLKNLSPKTILNTFRRCSVETFKVYKDTRGQPLNRINVLQVLQNRPREADMKVKNLLGTIWLKTRNVKNITERSWRSSGVGDAVEVDLFAGAGAVLQLALEHADGLPGKIPWDDIQATKDKNWIAASGQCNKIFHHRKSRHPKFPKIFEKEHYRTCGRISVEYNPPYDGFTQTKIWSHWKVLFITLYSHSKFREKFRH